MLIALAIILPVLIVAACVAYVFWQDRRIDKWADEICDEYFDRSRGGHRP